MLTSATDKHMHSSLKLVNLDYHCDVVVVCIKCLVVSNQLKVLITQVAMSER